MMIALTFLIAALSSHPAALVGATTLPPAALIVDDTDAGFQKFGPSQWWYTATGTSFNFYGGSTTYTFNVLTDTINYARWSLPVSATLPMTYEVFVFVPRYHSSTNNARYEIVSAGMTTTVAISQSRYYAEWVSLGRHYFDASGPHFVQLTDSTGEPLNSRRIGFDALAFVPQVTATITDGITGTLRAYLPLTIGGSGRWGGAIAASTSRYISTMDPQQHYAMGCASGRAGEGGTIILAFGQAWMQDDAFGVIYYRPGFPFASTATVAEAAKGFLRGYWECAPPSAQLNLAVGTNNYKGATGYAHGVAWGQMVNQLHAWLQANAPPGVSERLAVFGGNDIEMSWNTSALTRDWVNGYASATARPFINFGTCDGCPTTGSPDRQPNNGWTVDDVWFVNSAPVAIPFPEIYLRSGVNADQWYRMSLFAAQQKGAKLAFGGLLTQWQACQEKGTCGGLTDNTPQQGWQQLQDALNADPRTAMTLPPPSDITWRNEEGLTAKNVQDVRASVLRIASGEGEIVEGVAPPLSAMEFLPGNAWVNGRIAAFAGLVRDPAAGGDDADAHGGVAVFEVDAAGEYVSPPRLIRAPVRAAALRVVRAEDGVLMLSDGVVRLRFDVAARAWAA